jgi:hypothetical protein
MGPQASWQLSGMWSWDKADPDEIGPLGVLLPVGLYGKITVYLSQLPVTATTRRLYDSFLTIYVGYVSGRETLFWGSLGGGDNVCTMPFPVLFNESHLSALWSSPYTWSSRLYIYQWSSTHR